MHVATEVDTISGALFARNNYNTEFSGRVGFFNTDASIRSITCDRNEFIGRNGSLAQPAALRRVRLSGKAGTGLDQCAAIQVPFELQPGQEREIVFILGVGGRRNADASTMVQRHAGKEAARSALDACARTGKVPWAPCASKRLPVARRDRQWLADVPNHRLPFVGA